MLTLADLFYSDFSVWKHLVSLLFPRATESEIQSGNAGDDGFLCRFHPLQCGDEGDFEESECEAARGVGEIRQIVCAVYAVMRSSGMRLSKGDMEHVYDGVYQ